MTIKKTTEKSAKTHVKKTKTAQKSKAPARSQNTKNQAKAKPVKIVETKIGESATPETKVEEIKAEEPKVEEVRVPEDSITEPEPIKTKTNEPKRKRRGISKAILIVPACLVLVALAAGAVFLFIFMDKTVTCSQISDQPNLGYKTETKTEIIYNGNFVKIVKTNRKIKVDDSEKLSNLTNSYTRQYDMNNVSYSGYKYTITNTDETHAEINSEIDYNKFNMEKYLKDNPAMKEYTAEGKMTVDGAKKMYEKSGYSCK
jgi:hypothetical protein